MAHSARPQPIRAARPSTSPAATRGCTSLIIWRDAWVGRRTRQPDTSQSVSPMSGVRARSAHQTPVPRGDRGLRRWPPLSARRTAHSRSPARACGSFSAPKNASRQSILPFGVISSPGARVDLNRLRRIRQVPSGAAVTGGGFVNVRHRTGRQGGDHADVDARLCAPDPEDGETRFPVRIGSPDRSSAPCPDTTGALMPPKPMSAPRAR
jgi:hypothetical protein